MFAQRQIKKISSTLAVFSVLLAILAAVCAYLLHRVNRIAQKQEAMSGDIDEICYEMVAGEPIDEYSELTPEDFEEIEID